MFNCYSKFFQILKDNEFYLKLSECEFAKDQLEYLGHIIPAQGVATKP